MRETAQAVVEVVSSFTIGWFVVLNTISLALVLATAVAGRRSRRIPDGAALDDLFANPLTPGVSVLVPAYDEARSIVQSVQSVLALRYPLMEVVVTDDGSTDGTFDQLRRAFGLVPLERVPAGTVEVTGAVTSVHTSPDGHVVVVRKENAGRRGDALNAALEYARHPLVCMMDAASVLDPDALLHVVRPFVDDPEHVAGAGGVVRPVNGCPTERGRLLATRAPSGWTARIQVVEYLRLGRLITAPGTFGVFRRDLLQRIGGLTCGSLTEDVDLVTGLQRRLIREHTGHRIVFVPHQVCWTEVPETLRGLGAQRRRWSHGMLQVLMRFSSMIGNPRYGRTGLLVLPYYLLFELLAPVVELAGIAVIGAGAVTGMVPAGTLALFALAVLGYGALLSVVAIVVDDLTYAGYRRGSDLMALFGAAILENLGYRQLHAVWRVQGILAGLARRETGWGERPRVGFTTATSAG